MASNPKAPQVMESQQARQDDGEEGGHELSRTSALSVETAITQVARTHSADRTPRCPVGIGFLAKYGKPRRGEGRLTPEPTTESLMAI